MTSTAVVVFVVVFSISIASLAAAPALLDAALLRPNAVAPRRRVERSVGLIDYTVDPPSSCAGATAQTLPAASCSGWCEGNVQYYIQLDKHQKFEQCHIVEPVNAQGNRASFPNDFVAKSVTFTCTGSSDVVQHFYIPKYCGCVRQSTSSLSACTTAGFR